MRADGAGELGETTLVVNAMKGGLSGGTLASLRARSTRSKASGAAPQGGRRPLRLSPNRAGEPDGRGERDLRGVARDQRARPWIAPFVMASYNTRIVRRSNALQDWAYGRGFRYREVTGLGTGKLAPVVGAGSRAASARSPAASPFKPSRMLLDRVLPDPGEGPSEKSPRAGFFRMEIHTTTSTGAHYAPGSPPRATPATRRPR